MRGEAGATQVAGEIDTGLKISNSVRRGLSHSDLVWLHLKRIDGIRSQAAALGDRILADDINHRLRLNDG